MQIEQNAKKRNGGGADRLRLVNLANPPEGTKTFI